MIHFLYIHLILYFITSPFQVLSFNPTTLYQTELRSARKHSSSYSNALSYNNCPPHYELKKHSLATTGLQLSPEPQQQQESSDNDIKTTVGSKEYYQGFISRDMNEEPIERVSGDALLGPILKFVGGTSVVIAAFFFLFLISNGIIPFPSTTTN